MSCAYYKQFFVAPCVMCTTCAGCVKRIFAITFWAWSRYVFMVIVYFGVTRQVLEQFLHHPEWCPMYTWCSVSTCVVCRCSMYCTFTEMLSLKWWKQLPSLSSCLLIRVSVLPSLTPNLLMSTASLRIHRRHQLNILCRLMDSTIMVGICL